ncbi:tripartite tricarboxylate transporter substrate binding protein [Pseudonocardia eucalypti]|uniref:Tripartite tricarboxylate transporter substrate binding protein n=1 Tax=Pseudonocardia eucalypti TaxID=648755 RepID=A0ABP9PKI9_9PSEU|nr:putative tricarboxylic transport membrane protein [Pseudonocardia eucalypti]
MPRANYGKWLPLAVALLATALIVITAPAPARSAAQQVLDGRQLRIMAPAAPGGGWDQTAREMQSALRELVGRTEVYNVEGAGGTIGLSQFVRRTGEPTELMVTGLIMVGAIQRNHAPNTLADTTPLLRLTTDYQVIVVTANSPVRSMNDLVTAMRTNLPGVSISGGSAGGAEQILAGLIAQALRADPSKVNYIAHSGGGEALTTLLSGRSTAGISGVSELLPQIQAGTLRALAVSSPARVPALPDVPTLREGGVDVELQNWRGVVAPPGISPQQRESLEKLLVAMTRTPAWRDALARRGWGEATLAGPDFTRFVTDEQNRVTQVLASIGLR